MYRPAGVKTSGAFPIPDTMKAWVLGDPDELTLRDKPVPVPRGGGAGADRRGRDLRHRSRDHLLTVRRR